MTDLAAFDPVPALSAELSLPVPAVRSVVLLLAEGATVPFIARYRKEATGGLDEVQIRSIEERRTYLVELDERRSAVVAEIDKQGKLTDELRQKLERATTKAEVEDLYLPFKPKRRTRGMIARERGLLPLAELLWAQGTERPDEAAAAFVDAAKEVADVKAALQGARDICAERLAEDAGVRKVVREAYQADGVVRVAKEEAHKDSVSKFDTYASYEEPLAKIPSHRYLAIRRGEAEGVLRAVVHLEPERVLPRLVALARVKPASPWAAELTRAVEESYRRLLSPSVESDLRIDQKLGADRAAVDVFADNLRQLLLAAPFGTKWVLGIDPGQRTGCKCGVVDDTGKLHEHTVLYLVQGDRALAEAKQTLLGLLARHPIAAVAVGNGTHGRETEDFVREVLRDAKRADVAVVPVSEAGASVYSASDVARDEFPDLDLTVRGAVSIARRLQDPLAELVKIDPKSIGVGQYQHDVHQPLLGRKLDEVVESCVNSVGVELNTASAPLLARVAGIGPTLAKKIVRHRDEKGAFKSRKDVLSVPGVGPKVFEQSAGFLRVRGGEHPLDDSAVHPERYGLVEAMAKDLGVETAKLVANDAAIAKLRLERYATGDVGEFTLQDIVAELKKPGRDPRAKFEPPSFRDDVRTMSDLVVGMELEGVVTNVTAFGAFVDVGVHQDGLVHVSQLADRFVKEPSDVVKVGDKLKVRVMEIDLARKRIGLSARRDARPTPAQGQGQARPTPAPGQGQARRPPIAPEKRAAQGDGAKFTNNPFAVLGRR